MSDVLRIHHVSAIADRDGLLVELVAHRTAEARPAWGGTPGIDAAGAVHSVAWRVAADEAERAVCARVEFERALPETFVP